MSGAQAGLAERHELKVALPPAARTQPVGRLAGTQRLDVLLALPLRNREALTNLLQELYEPASTNYHRYLTPAEFARRFGPAEEDYQKLTAFAQANGLSVGHRPPNRTLLHASGTVASLEKTFHVILRRYQHPTEAREFYAPDSDPWVDAPVSVLAVSGLDNHILPRPMSLRGSLAEGGGGKRVRTDEASQQAIPFATGSGPRGDFIGRDFRAAYAPGVALDGTGQAVGLFELDGYFRSDVLTYENLAGLPNVPLTNVLLSGAPASPGANNIEVALDIDMAIAMAPGLTQVIVYEGSVPDEILNRMATDNLAQQLSCSWGFGPQTDPARDQIFQQFAAQGQAMFQASGDLGAYTGGVYPPSDNPFLTVVGGTSLSLSNGAWSAETVWSGSGGGVSTRYGLPVWQQGISMAANQGSSTMRNIPDVACLADPVIWLVANNGEQGSVGGTSAAAPLWAGFAALANQQAAAAGQPSLGFLNPALYSIGKGPGVEAAFHDVASGNNTNASSPTRFFAGPGYDLCTGWGTPTGSKLLSALLAPPPALGIAPATPVTFIGPVGGPFSAAASAAYFLTNSAIGTLNWVVTNSASWLTVSPCSGTLNGGGPGMTVNVAPNATASALPAGNYSASLGFTNSAEPFVQSRQVLLQVYAAPATPPGVSLATLCAFGGTTGANPNGLVLATNGLLYGTTENGGSNASGTLFQLSTNGALSSLYSFSGGEDGAIPHAPLAQGADGNLYGTAYQGGAQDNGTVFRSTLDGSVSALAAFDFSNGDLPLAGLVLGADGSFYGTGYQGGAYGRGTVFRVTTNGVLTAVYSFADGADGELPYAGLVQGRDLALYGTTYGAGAFGFGTVFRVTTSGALTTLHAFDSTQGSFPYGGLVQGGDGNFYGTTAQGGSAGAGTVFRISPTGEFTNLYSFSGGNDGSFPMASLLEAADGNFYGTTTFGGTYGDGTVFRLAPDGTLSTLAQFDGYNGANPQAALVQGPDGTLYGTARAGGAGDAGVAFCLTLSGAPQLTSQAASQTVFAGTDVPLAVAVAGSAPFAYQWRLNGTNLPDSGPLAGSTSRVLTLANVSTANIGSYSVVVSNAFGAITSAPAWLQVTSSAPFLVLQPTNQTLVPGAVATFAVSALGDLPLSYQWRWNGTNLTDGGSISGSTGNVLSLPRVTEANTGSYWVVVSNALGGVTSSVAVLTVMPVSAPGTLLTTLHACSGACDGSKPNGLMLATNGLLYGTTRFGGTSGAGTIFGLSTNGALTTLAAFGWTNGNQPQAALVQGADGALYGTTQWGGDSDAGTLFRVTMDGALSTVHSFTGEDDGGNPLSPLLLGSDTNLYGTTSSGGAAGYGNLFRVAQDGSLTALYSFTGGLDGGAPSAGLVQATDGALYGTTASGGTAGFGNIFRFSLNGTFSNLYSFTGGNDGYNPVGTLVPGTDGNLYGATRNNTMMGYQFYGTIFKVAPTGGLTTLYPLNYGDGSYPYAGVIEASDGNFYGTTHDGGTANNGTLFRISPDGHYAVLVHFDGFNDGGHPEAALVEGPDGALYGTTSVGGPGGQGTVFRLRFTGAPQIITAPVKKTALLGSNVVFSVTVAGSPALTYQWLLNGTNLSEGVDVQGTTNRVLQLSRLACAHAGTYSVVVSNQLGAVTSPGALLTVVPFPAVQVSLQANRTVVLTWAAASGQRYQVQYKNSLNTANWSNLGSAITATKPTLSVSDPVGANAQRFYRLVLTLR